MIRSTKGAIYLDGSICAITGPTRGIGRATASALARMGARLVLLCRNKEDGNALMASLPASVEPMLVQVDLADLTSVATAAEQICASLPRLDILINNAGVLRPSRRTTSCGLEEMFCVNHLSHFLLTLRLMPLLHKAATARIIHVASGSYAINPDFDFADHSWERRRFRVTQAYGQSKLAGVLFNRRLARMLAGSTVTSNAFDPGMVATDIGRISIPMRIISTLSKPFVLSPEQGAETAVYLASDPTVASSQGQYFVKCRPVPLKPWASDEAAATLWSISESLLAERGFLS